MAAQRPGRHRLSLPMDVRFTRGHRGLVSVHRGPLLFGLRMGEAWQQVRGEEPHTDGEIYPHCSCSDRPSSDALRAGYAAAPQPEPFGPSW